MQRIPISSAAWDEIYGKLGDSHCKLAEPGVLDFDGVQLQRLGATGEFPDGKANQHNEGALLMAFSHDEKHNVGVDFGKPVAWLMLPRIQAMQFAAALLEHAKAPIRVRFPGPAPAVDKEQKD